MLREGILDNIKRMAISHAIRKACHVNDCATVDRTLIEKYSADATLPTPAQQVDNAIRWMAEISKAPGERFDITPHLLELDATMGAASESGRKLILDHLLERKLASKSSETSWKLTFDGWLRFEELRLGAVSGNYGFIAMAFNKAPLTKIVDEHFRPAVEKTGFVLNRVDDVPRAGLIDDWLRVDIRGCRFLIADLTHHNNGAYWEAGYAEGLGKPVIYTCEKSVFEHKTQGTHFDTNHHLTVVWDEGQPEEAANLLKATIRASIPEAKQSDS